MSSRSDLKALLAFFFVDLGAILAAAILYCVAGILGIGMGYHRSKPRVIEEEEARCALRRGTFARVMRKMVSRIFTSWNQLERWFRDVDGLRRVA
jgi:hypothetical protein